MVFHVIQQFQPYDYFQDTLEEATALLVESQDFSDMETNGDSNEKEDPEKKCMFTIDTIDVWRHAKTRRKHMKL